MSAPGKALTEDGHALIIYHRRAPLSERHFLHWSHPHGCGVLPLHLAMFECMLWRFYLSALQSSVQGAGRNKYIPRILGLMQHPYVLAYFGRGCLAPALVEVCNCLMNSKAFFRVQARRFSSRRSDGSGFLLVPYKSPSVETSLSVSEDP